MEKLMLILCWNYLYIGCVETGCIMPQPVTNAYMTVTDPELPEGSTVEYICYQNFYLISGNTTRQCVNGEFTGLPPVCSETVPLGMSVATASPKHASTQEQLVVDGQSGTCESTAVGSTPSWIIQLSLGELGRQPKVHEVFLTWNPTANIGIDQITVSVDGPSFVICGTISQSQMGDGEAAIVCPNTPLGSYLLIEGSATSATSLNLCEVEVWGKDFGPDGYLEESCGDLPFVYGATFKEYNHPTKILTYKCEKGFYYAGYDTHSTCVEGKWTEMKILCLPVQSRLKLGYVGNDYPVINDGNDDTCIHDPGKVNHDWYTDTKQLYGFLLFPPTLAEVFSVTMRISENSSWSNIHVFVNPIGLTFKFVNPPCEYRGNASLVYPVRTFYCSLYAPTQELNLIIIITDPPSPPTVCEVSLALRSFTAPYECIRGEYEDEYKGYMNYAWDGTPCDNWADAPPDKAINTTTYPYFKPVDSANYCRNIGGTEQRPWCWVKNFTEFMYCPLTFCHDLCKPEGYQYAYEGTQSFSTSGRTCDQWSNGNEDGDQFITDVFPENIFPENYCRNPGESQLQPWCYVTGPGGEVVAEACDIPSCPTGFPIFPIYNNDSSGYPIYFTQCYHPLDALNVKTYYRLNITEDNINSMCLMFMDELLYCFQQTEWFLVEFRCYNVTPESSSLSMSPSPIVETTMIEETGSSTISDVASSIFDSLTVYSDSIPPTASTGESSSLDLNPPSETSSSTDAYTSQTSSSIDVNPSQTSSSIDIDTTSVAVPCSHSSYLPTATATSSSDVNIASLTTTADLSPSYTVHFTGHVDRSTSLEFTGVFDTPYGQLSTFVTEMPASSASTYFDTDVSNSSQNVTCGCFCANKTLFDISDPLVQERLDALTKALHLDYDKLSATIRRHISADDDRPSVIYVGSSALVILITFLALLVFPDFLKLCRFFKEIFCSRKKT